MKPRASGTNFRLKRKSLLVRYTVQTLRTLAIWSALPQLGIATEHVWMDMARASITTSELQNHAAVLADDTFEGREMGSRGGHAAAKYILGRLAEAGLSPGGPNEKFVQRFSGRSQNLLAVIEGSDPALQDEYLIVGAHYDHVGYGTRRNSYGPWGFIHNGADDNASGVATLLEVIDAFARTEWQPRRSILFAFWDGEEKGLLGSKHWLANPTVPPADVKLVINVDMVGRLAEGRLEIGGTRTATGLRHLLSSSTLAPKSWLDFSWDYRNNSDHWTFYEAGIPSVYIHTGLHDDYHRPSDDVEKLNVEGMRQVARYLLEELSEAADADTLPVFRSASRRETPAIQKTIERRLPDLMPRLGITWHYVDAAVPYLLVQEVSSGSAAWQAGLRPKDRIVAVDDLPMTSRALLPAVVLRAKSQVELLIQRMDENLTVAVPLQSKPVRLGMSWRADPAEPAMVYVTRIVPGSPAERAGLRVLDRIRRLDGEPLQGQDELLDRIAAQLDEQAEQLVLEIESRGRVQEIAISLRLPTLETTDPTL